MHIFWSLREFWTTGPSSAEQPGVDILNIPRQEDEVVRFKDMLATLRAAGHQVYVSLYAGISHIKPHTCSETLLLSFEQAMLQCVCAAAEVGALADTGLGFWTEHNKMWNDEEWFSVMLNEQLLAITLDGYIMRQKVMLHLSVQNNILALMEQKQSLSIASFKLFNVPWPETIEAARGPQ